MDLFSNRYGYRENEPQFETASQMLKERIFAYFYNREFKMDSDLDLSTQLFNKRTVIERMMTEYGIVYEPPTNNISKKKNAESLQAVIVRSSKWYVIYDFIEKYFTMISGEQMRSVENDINRILEEECSGYRVIEGLVTPITNEMELSAIRQSYSTKYDSVNMHISKALTLYSDRRKPDYENSIKESISAVEAMCCIITGSGATLGAALKKLKDKGVHIHGAMESSFSSLYGYASDESGIRHGGIDFANAPSEDAKYMLISCSAFVNYLIEKWNKVSEV